MPLAAGRKLGPYEIVAAAGGGGMGEVYRARDTRLDRTVAIKIIPAHLSASPELKQRFEREAKAVSSLNHPYICHVYDVGSQDGIDFLVMEYVEGQTLAQRLQKGPLPVEDALKIGVEVADALARAHQQGIIHRDLKPGNIMLTKSGAKLMDFGLAKSAAPLAGPGSTPTPITPSTPTMSIGALALSRAPEPLTKTGTVVGTFQYMAPEVLQGTEADTRSDIFSFGCVLYEMITGHPAFQGKSQISVLAAILEKEPEPMATLQPMTPPALEHVVATCLAKNPDDRWQHASDVERELKWITTSGSKLAPLTVRPARDRRRERVALLALGLVALLAIAVALWQAMRPAAPAPLVRSSILLGKNVDVLPFDLAFSPDGSKLAFVARSSNGQALWVRSTDSLQPQLLAGTDDARYPFWSPDSRRIGFFAGNKLKIVELAGGAVINLADVVEARGATWSKDDTIIFAPNFASPLVQIPATGGVPIPLTEINTANQETSHRWPSLLPDGRHVLLYVEGQRSTGAPSADPTDKVSGLYELDLKTKERKFVAASDSGALFASGYILYVRRQSLMAQPFDPEHGRTTGAPVGLLQQQVAYDSDRWSAAFAVAPNGLLAYVEGAAAAFSQLEWIDRSGKVLGNVGGAGVYAYPALSPDGKRVAVQENTQQGSDIWIIDLERGTKARLTFDGHSAAAVWSPDGKRVAYSSDRTNRRLVYVKDATGLGAEQPMNVPAGADQNIITDWSRDGRALVYASSMPSSRNRLFVHWLEPGQKDDYLLPAGNAGWREATFSPDGKWLAYSSDESGRWEIYVVPFPQVNGKFQISTSGGMQPRWRRDGKELFYVGLDRKLMAVALSTSPSFKASIPQPLFATSLAGAPFATAQYDVSADGRRFLVSSRLQEATSQPITIVANWTAELNK